MFFFYLDRSKKKKSIGDLNNGMSYFLLFVFILFFILFGRFIYLVLGVFFLCLFFLWVSESFLFSFFVLFEFF